MPADDFVILESDDGYSFVVPRNIAIASGTLKAMLDEDAAFQEAENKTCRLHYRGIIVQKVIEYLAFKVQYADFSSSDIREDFADRIDPYIALELLTAADYLDT
ncbi:Elongin-C [Vanrija pseudolonga]|uniref:Elongin-C n=1 Tax=Vanrija pseudolonga TaxID=143232 RepID=A0AAF0Y7F1_9TREE|nr:Elongin-C [Vanrija pseudolonga]